MHNHNYDGKDILCSGWYNSNGELVDDCSDGENTDSNPATLTFTVEELRKRDERVRSAGRAAGLEAGISAGEYAAGIKSADELPVHLLKNPYTEEKW